MIFEMIYFYKQIGNKKIFDLPVMMVLPDVDVTITDDAEVVDKVLDDEEFIEGIIEDSWLFAVSFLCDANKGFFCG